MIFDAKQKDSNKMKNFLIGKNCSAPPIKFRSALTFTLLLLLKSMLKPVGLFLKWGMTPWVCRCSLKYVLLNIFPKFTAKHLCWSLFNKVAGPHACNFIKKRLQYSCFPVNITPFSQNTSG